MDEYGYLYDEHFGLTFLHNGRRIGKSQSMTKSEVEELPSCKSNGDNPPLFVLCKSCDEFMNFDGYFYRCENCGTRVKETTLLNQLERECKSYESEWEEFFEE